MTTDKRDERRRVLVSGTRHGIAKREWQWLRERLVSLPWRDNMVIVHGAQTGVDSAADLIAKNLGIPREPHPADWDGLGKKAGPIRNSEMIESGIDYVIAMPAPDSRGTWNVVRMAERKKIDYEVHHVR